MSEFERIVEMRGAFDRRHPDPAKNYGIHGMEIRFVLKGEAGAVQFLVYTNMHLPHVREEQRCHRHEEPFEPRFDLDAPMGADIGYHSRVPHYDGHTPMKGDGCEYLDGAPCYYDGSGMAAEEFMPEFLAGGSDAVWKMLEQRYAEEFVPAVAEAVTNG